MASGNGIEVSAPGYQTVVIKDRRIDVGVKHRLSMALEAVVVNLLAHKMLNWMMPTTSAAPVQVTNGVGV